MAGVRIACFLGASGEGSSCPADMARLCLALTRPRMRMGGSSTQSLVGLSLQLGMWGFTDKQHEQIQDPNILDVRGHIPRGRCHGHLRCPRCFRFILGSAGLRSSAHASTRTGPQWLCARVCDDARARQLGASRRGPLGSPGRVAHPRAAVWGAWVHMSPRARRRAWLAPRAIPSVRAGCRAYPRPVHQVGPPARGPRTAGRPCLARREAALRAVSWRSPPHMCACSTSSHALGAMV